MDDVTCAGACAFHYEAGLRIWTAVDVTCPVHWTIATAEAPMADHVVIVSTAPGGVALDCSCGLRVVRPTKTQADAALVFQHGLAASREALGGAEG